MAARVLIVDDQPLLRARIRELLASELDFEVVAEAQSGAQALERYRELRPDLVTIDIVMPEMDGIETLRRLRSLDPAARVVMVSSEPDPELVSRSLAAGASDFVRKPVAAEALVAALRHALERA